MSFRSFVLFRNFVGDIIKTWQRKKMKKLKKSPRMGGGI